MPTQEELNRVLSYNPFTGILTTKVCRGKIHAGDDVGSRTSLGYIQHSVGNKRLLAHRIIWTMLYGEIPAGSVVDHINGVPHDNRLSNLRLVSVRMNLRNTKRHKHNTSGVMGVRWVQKTKMWEASLSFHNNKTYLGRFLTFEEAVACRKQAEAQHGYHPNHGRVLK